MDDRIWLIDYSSYVDVWEYEEAKTSVNRRFSL